MKILKLLFSRLVIVGLIIVIQVGWFVLFLLKLGRYSLGINIAFSILSLIVTIYIVNKKDNPAVKLAWVIPILMFPLLGGLLYIMFGGEGPGNFLRRKLESEYIRSRKYIEQDEDTYIKLTLEDKRVANQADYLWRIAGFPVHQHTATEFFRSGEDNFAVMKEELRKAEHFIFMEYFIINKGKMWDELLAILRQKAREGVEVRLIYDDMGCLDLLPYHYYKTLEREGIKCIAFNPFVPFFSVVMNNRDHRKIMVIDGYTGFTGGINLADEYINEIHPHGYWKDTGIMLKGEAVWNLTLMFLQTWNGLRKTSEDYALYRPHVYYQGEFESDGYVQPYGDTPLDHETVGENVYLNIINQSKDYVYIYTPYLIIDNEMVTALSLAAKRGVDVRIVTPGIPDKKFVFWLTRSYYGQLLNQGVRIYEYTPGFIHAKCFVCDDEIATVGTINMDYRSLYLHFECGTFLYKTKAVMQVRRDMIDTIGVSREITSQMAREVWPIRVVQAVLRCLAPLF